jgi:phytol kinase
MMKSNLLALILTFVASLVWLRVNDYIAHRGWVSSHLSRKFIHMGTGPVFVLCWLLFNDAPSARYLATLVPAMITAQFALVGFGIIQDEGSVKGMSRSGDPREILRGPLYYGIVFVLVTLLYWRQSPIGITALMLMCGGDGLAEIFGRTWGKTALPWAKGKTWIGSLGMFIGGWIFAVAVIAAYVAAGRFAAPFSGYLPPVTLIALAGTAVESLPFKDIDNFTVTVAAILLGHLLF